MSSDNIDMIIYYVSEYLRLNLSLYNIMDLTEDNYENLTLSDTEYQFLLKLILYLSKNNTYPTIEELEDLIIMLGHQPNADIEFILYLQKELINIYNLIKEHVYLFLQST